MVALENTHDAYVLYVSFGTDQVTREKQSGGGATLHHLVLLLGLFLLLPTCSPTVLYTTRCALLFLALRPPLAPWVQGIYPAGRHDGNGEWGYVEWCKGV